MSIDFKAYAKMVGYEPHREQVLFHNSKARFRVPVCGRRFGKSVMAGRDLGVELFKPRSWYWVVGPTYDLAEKEFRVVWDDLIIGKRFGRDKRVRKAYNKKQGEMFIEFPWRTRLECRSARHKETLVGEGLDGAIISEAAKQDEETWKRFIRPALSDKRGWATFPTTPEGANWLHKLWQLGNNPDYPDYESWSFPSWKNTVIYPLGYDDPEIQEMVRSTSKDWFDQEIGASFSSFVGKIYGEFQETDHVRKVEFRPDWPNYITFDWGFCVDTETEILTQRGWLTHDQLTVDDYALTQNPKTGVAEWQQVQGVHRFNGTFDMRSMEHSQHSSFSTSNHRWLVQNGRGSEWKFKETDQVTRSDFIASALPCTNVPEVPKYSDAFVELVAWYWTEGSRGDFSAPRIWQSQIANPDNCARIRAVLQAVVGDAWAEVNHKSGCQMFRGRKIFGDMLLEVMDREKVVTSAFIASLTKAQLQLFIDVSLLADGWTTSDGSRLIAQKELDRIHPLQMACALLGIATTVKQQKNDQWNLTLLSRSQTYPKYKQTVDVVYQGTVWCPTTPNGTWYARRRGTTYFTGNTNPLAAVEFQVGPSDQIHVWREHYKAYTTVPEHCAILNAREQPEGYRIDGCFGDAADPEAAATVGMLLAPCQVNALAKTNWREGVELVKSFLKMHQVGIADEYGTPLEEPKMLVDHSCTNVISEFNSYKSKKPVSGNNVPEMGQNQRDHTLDALRYGLMHIFKLGATHHLSEVLSGPLSSTRHMGGTFTATMSGLMVPAGSDAGMEALYAAAETGIFKMGGSF